MCSLLVHHHSIHILCFHVLPSWWLERCNYDAPFSLVLGALDCVFNPLKSSTCSPSINKSVYRSVYRSVCSEVSRGVEVSIFFFFPSKFMNTTCVRSFFQENTPGRNYTIVVRSTRLLTSNTFCVSGRRCQKGPGRTKSGLRTLGMVRGLKSGYRVRWMSMCLDMGVFVYLCILWFIYFYTYVLNSIATTQKLFPNQGYQYGGDGDVFIHN